MPLAELISASLYGETIKSILRPDLRSKDPRLSQENLKDQASRTTAKPRCLKGHAESPGAEC
jgi:hypothetical protein